ncbi:PIG-L deacetylase family protein [Plesiomonas shigelloides]
MCLSFFKKVLVLAPHTDDGELGAGGFIAKLIDAGSEVTYVAFSIAEDSVPAGLPKDILKTEVKLATAKLGINPKNLIILNFKVRKFDSVRQEILEELIKLRKLNDFDLVLIPSSNDVHQDHAVISQEGIRAFKGTTVLGYELIWNNICFNNSFFVKLKREHVERKIAALKCYKSQFGRCYVSEDFIFALSHTRGVQINTQYAESFEVIRWVMS